MTDPRPLTPEGRAALRALCETATPGPWRPNIDSRISIYVVATGGWVAQVTVPYECWQEPDRAVRERANAAFIAAARTALPAALDLLDRQADLIEATAAHERADVVAWMRGKVSEFKASGDRREAVYADALLGALISITDGRHIARQSTERRHADHE